MIGFENGRMSDMIVERHEVGWQGDGETLSVIT